MFTKGSDLENRFPEVAFYVSISSAISRHDINGFLFVKKPRARGGNFFRVRGQVTPEQVSQLLRLHNLPKNSQGRENGNWVEYSILPTFDQVLLEKNEGYTHWATQLCDVYDDLADGEDSDYPIASVYVNGREVKYDQVNSHELGRGDVVVIFSDYDEEDFGSFRTFSNMPKLNVYQETLFGPLDHPKTENLWPSEILNDSTIVKDWKLRLTDEIVCPYCGDTDCMDHTLKADQKVYVRRKASKGKVLYTIQSPLLIGDDATEKLKPFAKCVIGKNIVDDEWPEKVSIVEIDENNVTYTTCGETITETSVVDVVLADPKFKHLKG